MTCKCHKCYKGIWVKNIKKACVNRGFPEPKNKAFVYFRERHQMRFVDKMYKSSKTISFGYLMAKDR